MNRNIIDEIETAACVLESISPADRGYIEEILSACAGDLVLFEDWEFSTLFGVDRDRFRVLAARWHEVLKDHGGDPGLRGETLDVVLNALGHAFGYPGAAERVPHAAQAPRLHALLTGQTTLLSHPDCR